MSTAGASPIAELRRSFDDSFALPPASAPEPVENLLLVRVAGDPYALRVSELSGLNPRRRIVPLAGAPASLLGLAGIRGRLVPVYRLASLFGYANTIEEDDRWLALCGGDDAAALAFPHFEGHRQPPRSSLLTLARAQSSTHLRECVRLDGQQVPVIDAASLLQGLSRH